MAERRSPGEKTAARLAARAEEGLQRKETPDGGEVYTGPLARRALRALGARAMTVDRSIVVDQSFDISNPEDQALYAHETVHKMGSGGHGAEGSRDAEEVAARAIERMVLHRARAGADPAPVMRDAAAGASGSSGSASAASAPAGDESPQDESEEATAAYASMLGEGLTHEQIVRELSRYVLEQMQTSEERNRMRIAPSKSL